MRRPSTVPPAEPRLAGPGGFCDGSPPGAAALARLTIRSPPVRARPSASFMKAPLRGLFVFLFGLLVGGGATYAAFTRHLVRADDGWHCVPNGGSSVADCYADVRGWTPAEWTARPRVAGALVEAGQGDVVMRTSANGLMDRLTNRR